jgi:hypothetical protein
VVTPPFIVNTSVPIAGFKFPLKISVPLLVFDPVVVAVNTPFMVSCLVAFIVNELKKRLKSLHTPFAFTLILAPKVVVTLVLAVGMPLLQFNPFVQFPDPVKLDV